jgi:hypothetical protein
MDVREVEAPRSSEQCNVVSDGAEATTASVGDVVG